MTEKRRVWIAALGIALILILVLLAFFYLALYKQAGNDSYYNQQTQTGKLVNPASGLSLEEAINEFNETFVHYILYSIKAYNLHNPPLSSNEPKIEFFVDSDAYSARIVDGEIIVSRGEMEEKDVIITTTKSEAVQMLQNQNYIFESFESGKSSFEMVESKSTLFAKGYLSLYQELTGKSITGSVVRMYVS